MRVVCLSVITLMLAACGEEKSPEILVQDAARYYNSNGEGAFADLYPGSKTRAYAEGGNTLVARIENVPSGKQVLDPIMWTKGVRQGLCSDQHVRDLLEKGVKFRLEMRSNMGVDLPTAHLATCVG